MIRIGLRTGTRAAVISLAYACIACGSDRARGSTDPSDIAPPHIARDAEAPPANASPDAGRTPVAPITTFGANISASGGVRFRVWAPNATEASVVGDFPEGRVPMPKAADGKTFDVTVAGAHEGSKYAFQFQSLLGTIERLDPYCRELSADGKRCVVIDPSTFGWPASGTAGSFRPPSRSEAIVYEIHIGSFTSAGTFAAAKARLADLADLGVNVVELMPVHAFGGSGRGWGYNPQLWFAPRQTYGSADELRAFVDEAHRNGIAVWIDTVFNHYDNWGKAPLRCFDGDCGANGTGIYFFDQGPYANTPWGPRPDYSKPEVNELLRASIEQWLVEFRGDGFRWDSVSNIRALDGSGTTPGGRELIVAANDRTHQLGGISVAEDLKGLDAITQPSKQQGFGYDAQWDGFIWDVPRVLANGSDDARDLGVVDRALRGGYAGDGFARLVALETHDTVGNGGARLPTRIDGANPKSWKARKVTLLGGVLLLSTPAMPMLFMGEESLVTDGFGGNPSPLPSPDAIGLKIRAFYKDMLALRRTLPDLVKPAVTVGHRNDAAKVIAYRRGDVVVILNFRNQAYARYDIGVPKAGPWHVRLNTESSAYGDDFGDGQTGAIDAISATKDGEPYTLPLKLAPYSAMVLTP
jgi:1,4-alpha-glucan branching enzyme